MVAILLAIFLALRKNETRADDGSAWQGVGAQDFEQWRARALAAYTLGIRACFAKVLVDFALAALFERFGAAAWLRMALGVSLDVAWVAVMLVVWVRAHRAQKLGDGLRRAGAQALAASAGSPDES
jgi:hypothetical protein